MAKKKPTKQQIKEDLDRYQEVEDVIESLPAARLPKRYKDMSAEKKAAFTKHLKHLLHEFMDSYMLIGFSAEGMETIIVENHGTPIETRGLNHLAFDFFNQYFDDDPSFTIIDPDEL
jgi:hypothetical protein